ncbi:MAG: queuosine salvage family protein [Acidobacteriia bacterium]|jgi:hypothetical protein|nr:queuosine salvage family protein [Terriglobia bacterium]
MNPFISTLEPIWSSPTCVFIDEKRLRVVSEELSKEPLELPNWRLPVFPSDDDETFTNFLGVGNSINFAFTDFSTYKSFEIEYNGGIWKGAFAMWGCILRALERGKEVLKGRFLRNLNRKEFDEIFAGKVPIPMADERLRILNEIGAVLETHYGGEFSNLFIEARFRAFGGNGIVDRLTSQFSSFRDESVYKRTNAVLKFHKRAQLLPMMYQGRAAASTVLPQIADFEDLGPIADYAVPRGLHNAGILSYAPELQSKIIDRVLIPKDSIEEQEIRAQTENVQWKLLQVLQRMSTPAPTMLHIDYKVWSLGRGAKEPHHLTKTSAY